MARGGGCAVMPAGFSFTAQRLKPSLSHGRTRAELKFTEGRGRHVFCFAAGYEGLCFNGTATFLLRPFMLLVLRLVGSEAQPTVVTRPRGGGVHCTPSPDESPFPSGSPNLGVQLQRKGSHDENLFVGASPVVDYFAFMLENLANSALHRVSGEPLRRCVLRPVDQASNEKQVVERFSCCNT